MGMTPAVWQQPPRCITKSPVHFPRAFPYKFEVWRSCLQKKLDSRLFSDCTVFQQGKVISYLLKPLTLNYKKSLGVLISNIQVFGAQQTTLLLSLALHSLLDGYKCICLICLDLAMSLGGRIFFCLTPLVCFSLLTVVSLTERHDTNCKVMFIFSGRKTQNTIKLRQPVMWTSSCKFLITLLRILHFFIFYQLSDDTVNVVKTSRNLTFWNSILDHKRLTNDIICSESILNFSFPVNTFAIISRPFTVNFRDTIVCILPVFTSKINVPHERESVCEAENFWRDLRIPRLRETKIQILARVRRSNPFAMKSLLTVSP